MPDFRSDVLCLALLFGALRCNLAHQLLIADNDKVVTRLARAFEAGHLQGLRGATRRHTVTTIVEQGTHATILAAGNEHVADLERAALHQCRGDRPPALFKPRFDDHALSRPVMVGPEIEKVRRSC